MVNAGIVIRTFDGLQQWDDTAGIWRGIGVKVNYPSDQTVLDNPVDVGDVLIEPNGSVWDVMGVVLESEGSSSFRLDLKINGPEPTDEISPSLGEVTRGGIITPINGMVLPYWDATVVSGEVSRIGQYITMKNAPGLWHGDVYSQPHD